MRVAVPSLPMWRRDWDDAGVDSVVEDESTDAPDGYVFFCPFVFPTLLFFSLFFFPIIYFAAEYNDELGETGRDQRGWRQKCGAGRGSKSAHSVVFFFSFSFLLYSSSYLTLLLLR